MLLQRAVPNYALQLLQLQQEDPDALVRARFWQTISARKHKSSALLKQLVRFSKYRRANHKTMSLFNGSPPFRFFPTKEVKLRQNSKCVYIDISAIEPYN